MNRFNEYDHLPDTAINFRLSRLKGITGPVPNYCNDPAAGWALICEHRLDLEWGKTGMTRRQATVSARKNGISTFYSHENPFRAAAIVMLKLWSWLEKQKLKGNTE